MSYVKSSLFFKKMWLFAWYTSVKSTLRVKGLYAVYDDLSNVSRDSTDKHSDKLWEVLIDGYALNEHTYLNRTPEKRRKIQLQVHSHPIQRKE